jgi:uncharacterized protein YjeT (DUF2065 family)
MIELKYLALLLLTLLMVEGFVLSVFPRQFQQMVAEIDPRALQAGGLVETILALGLAAAVVLG